MTAFFNIFEIFDFFDFFKNACIRGTKNAILCLKLDFKS
jgi:hypothetical protein